MNTSKADLNKSPDKRANILLRLFGPGLVTGAADDDPSGIATYSQAGAQFGYGLLWTVFLTTPFMIAIQLDCVAKLLLRRSMTRDSVDQ
jgi:Mn2+/Fe2+ NRAMP family transporter